MGANIGTTVTSWIVSMGEWSKALKPEFIAPLFVGIGAFLYMFTKSEKKKDIGQIVLGFGVLFIGLSFMSNAIVPYKDSPIFVKVFSTLGRNPIFGILAGVIVTGIIQSSSASVGILQTLAANGVVNWSSAIYITLGQNIGTCVTALISSAGGSRNGKRAAVIHLLFNTIGAIIYAVVMFVLFRINTVWAASEINSIQISVFHTIFNITNTILLFPFANHLVKLSGFLVKERPEEKPEDEFLFIMEDGLLESPSFAIEAALKQVSAMGQLVMDNYDLSVTSVMENDEKKAGQVFANEARINRYEEVLAEFLVKINELPMNENQYKQVKNLLYTISDLERIGDHSENLAEIAGEKFRKEIVFSGDAKTELEEMTGYVRKSLEAALLARSLEQMDSVQNVVKYENIVDEMEQKLREKHIERLADGQCSAGSGVVFLDLISNLERISDHAHNIAQYVREEIE